MKRFLILLTLFLSLATSVFADPISKDEADGWVNHVRNIMQWPPGFDVRKEAEQRRDTAELHLKLFPTSEEYKRDLADSLHTLGHFAEHDHDFDLAISLHRKSLSLFKQSGYHTKESWDGIEHALEHLFMDQFDKAIQLQQQGKPVESAEWLKKAFNSFLDHPLIFSKLSRGQRVAERLESLYHQPFATQTTIREYLDAAKQLPAGSCKRLFL